MPPNKVLRVAVAGLGFGATVHVPGLRRVQGVEVCAIAGRDVVRASEAATRLNVPVGVGDFRALMDHGIDAVTLALPPDVGARAASFFLGNGVPVLMEKPIAADEATARKLADASRASTCAVDFQFRELEAFGSVHQALDAGAIGLIRHVNLGWLVESLANRQGGVTWKTDSSRVGGVLSMMAPHALYLVEWLFAPVTGVFAKLQSRGMPWHRGVQPAADTLHLVLLLRGGIVVSALLSNASPGLSNHRWEVVGERGSLLLENVGLDYMSGFHAELRHRGKSSMLCESTPNAVEDGRIEPFAKLASRFVACVRANGRLKPDFEDGWRVQRLIDAAKISNESGSVVTID